MQTIRQEIQIKLQYSVHFTQNLFAPENRLLKGLVSGDGAILPRKVLFVVDRGVYRHFSDLLTSIEAYCGQHASVLDLVCTPLLIQGGEAVKNNPEHVRTLHEAIHQFGLCRQSFVVAVGGGALLDMAGYAAATAHRGVRLIRVPTTVLSQNDSALGVKNSINAFGKKNFLGTFTPPFAVLNDSNFLTTLSDRDWRSGISEAIKVALIKDASFFAFLERHAASLINRDMPPMLQLIQRCAQLHLDHIASSGDPFELGTSRPLDFGHWAAHKLEQATDYRLRHGEAVAVGMALDATYSYLSGFLLEPAWQRIIRLITRLGFKLHVPELDQNIDQREEPSCIFHGLTEFREHLGGQLTIMLLKSIGEGFEVHEMDEDVIRKSISKLKQIADSIPLNEAQEEEWECTGTAKNHPSLY